MAKGPYRLNLIAGWDRNLNPARKVASVCATFARDSDNPAFIAVRIAFWNPGHAKRWLEDSKLKSVGGKLVPLSVRKPDMNSIGITWYQLDLEMYGRGPLDKFNQKNRQRYKKLMTAVLADNYTIDWQVPPYIPRTYEAREAFERIIECQV